MAIIEKIRTRAGVLVAIVIGISLLAFILGDFLESGRLLFLPQARVRQEQPTPQRRHGPTSTTPSCIIA